MSGDDETGGSAHSAEVVVLTAEVRVLMVGNRQVTLSVFAQLDRIDFDDIEPMGRVRPRGADDNQIWVIGRHTSSGELVRALVRYMKPVPIPQPSGNLVARREQRDRKGAANLAPYDIRVLNTMEAEYSADVEKAEKYNETVKRERQQWPHAITLPLIVLAGLR